MVMSLPRHFTAADLAAMPDDGLRYEVVRGELLVSPSPNGWHQVMVSRLFAALLPHLQAGGLADQLITAPADVPFAADTVLQPDLFVAEMSGVLKSGQWIDLTTLFLVIEVLSPSTARADRSLKRPEYQAHGVPQYWIVDGDQRHVEVWTPDAREPVIVRDQLVWRHPALDVDCMIDLRRLFDVG